MRRRIIATASSTIRAQTRNPTTSTLTERQRSHHEQRSSQGRHQGGRGQGSAEDRQAAWERRPASQGPCNQGPRQGKEEGRRREGSSAGREKQAPIEVTSQANLSSEARRPSLSGAATSS